MVKKLVGVNTSYKPPGVTELAPTETAGLSTDVVTIWAAGNASSDVDGCLALTSSTDVDGC